MLHAFCPNSINLLIKAECKLQKTTKKSQLNNLEILVFFANKIHHI